MSDKLHELENQLQKLKGEIAAERRKVPPAPVADYPFLSADGSPVSLSQLFGDKTDLLVIHNMGRACPYCTLWADGLNGFTAHLENRAAFVLASPDDPQTMSRFAAARGWAYRTVSSKGSPFGKDMGFEPEPGKYAPGVSAFAKKDNGVIVRTGKAIFGPGDDFCSVWPLFELLAQGVNGWEPKYAYQ